MKKLSLYTTILVSLCAGLIAEEKPINISGIYPHLTLRNDEGECGTGAVVPWQGDLWVITYAPHQPRGSSDKLYRITPNLEQKIFPGSVGGTPANRMIHRETNQLLIGPYLIDAEKQIRVIPQTRMLGRLTGNARHLTDPASKVYYATMEEGLYEVDLKTLDVTCLIRDGHAEGGPGVKSQLPGYHGKGLYSGQGHLVYTNNGDRAPGVKTDPTTTSGALAQWFGEGDWQMVRRNQFTEASGPGGIFGNPNPDSDPVWSMGWDAKSLILALLEDREWHYYRLPKGSHSYDGAHGWNTEWPRIREIGEDDLLATMHGTFWRFPKTFSKSNSAGIRPRSNYLKVIGDFCRWNDKVVFGCDDTAKSEFLNTRDFKAHHAASRQSNSNLWFVDPETIDNMGPVIGRGSVWLRQDLEADQTSDPYLFSGYDHRQIHIYHNSEKPVTFALQIDRTGNGEWEKLKQLTVPSGEPVSYVFEDSEMGEWIRLVSQQAAKSVTVHFQYRSKDSRSTENNPMFTGIADRDTTAASFGLMKGQAFDRLGIVAAGSLEGEDASYYEINQRMEFVKIDDPVAAAKLVKEVAQPERSVQIDDASVLIVEDGKRYRLPKSLDFMPTAIPESKESNHKTLEDFLSENLAKGAKATASSHHEDYSADHISDGLLTDESRWIASGQASLELDLGEEKTFRSLWVVTGWQNDPQYAAKNFSVQIADADGNWQSPPEAQITNNHSIRKEIVFEKPVSTDKVRIVSSDSGYFRLYEIALFDRKIEVNRNDMSGFGISRICREVATERDLLNVHGSFYELPARNAQGVAKIRPVATHNLIIHDFCSHNGLLFFTGIDRESESEHIFRSDDGKAAVWAGVVDDLWKLGKPTGSGGPWKDSAVEAGTVSDPYLMTAYDKKSLFLSADRDVSIEAEVDIDGTGLWIPYKSWEVSKGTAVEEIFPEGFSAYWIRFRASGEAAVIAKLIYE